MKYLDPNRFCSLTVHESDIKLEQRPCRYNAFTLDFHLTLMQHCVRLTQNTSRTAHHCALGLSRFLHTGKSTWLHRRTNRKKPHQIAYAVLHLCGEPAEDNTNGGEKKGRLTMSINLFKPYLPYNVTGTNKRCHFCPNQ